MTPGQWLDALLAMPGRVASMVTEIAVIEQRTGEIKVAQELTQAAIADLVTAVDEVATELDALDAKLTEGSTVDAATAAAIKPIADRLRGLRPDPWPPVETP